MGPVCVRAQDAAADPSQPFDGWLSDLKHEALARGFSSELVERALGGVEPLQRVIASDRSQAELVPGFKRYMSLHVTPAIIDRGRALGAEHGPLLGEIERRFGVQRRFLLAIWGIETRYGRITGDVPIFQALATLAWEGRRSPFFRGELFNALTMVDRGYIDVTTMTGSWAGAMGQPQFLPSSYLAYAVDFDEDGRRDIWRSTGDALASMANYLKAFGWNGGETWGREVRLPADLRATIDRTVPKRTTGCFARRNMTERRLLAEWDAMGVRLAATDRPLPRADMTAGLVDVDERTFLVYPNYDAILAYNCAHYYALTVALLAERLRE
jgi:membrane-bound lytic murein transglycosylase B